jgi:hypothetical protein
VTNLATSPESSPPRQTDCTRRIAREKARNPLNGLNARENDPRGHGHSGVEHENWRFLRTGSKVAGSNQLANRSRGLAIALMRCGAGIRLGSGFQAVDDTPLEADESTSFSVGVDFGGVTGVTIWVVGRVWVGSIGSTATGGVIILDVGRVLVGSIGLTLVTLLGVIRLGIRSKLGRKRRWARSVVIVGFLSVE